MSWIWITGRQPKKDWDEHHSLAKEMDGVEFEEVREDDPSDPPQGSGY
jgi:hypothetical protein